MAISIDLPGRVRNIVLYKSNCLNPLFEAVVNSIQEIAEVKKESNSLSKGRIFITIERATQQMVIEVDGVPVSNRPILGFTVEDDGIGFTSENFKSFERSDTTRKIKKGGKGVGRFLWLKAFEKVHIDSTFLEDGKWYRRSLDFLCTEAGIENHRLDEVRGGRRRTTIHLNGLKNPYRDVCPKKASAISKQIIEHCMPYMVLGVCPQIVVHDPDEGTSTDLGDVFEREIKIGESTQAFGLNGRTFNLTHILTKSSEGADHRLYYCAHVAVHGQ